LIILWRGLITFAVIGAVTNFVRDRIDEDEAENKKRTDYQVQQQKIQALNPHKHRLEDKL